MKRITTVLAAVAIAASATLASAAYPEKPVKIIVAYPPGGATDVVARKLAQKLQEQTGQPFIVENKPGATGTIGTRFVAEAPADGYTLLAIENTFSIYPHVFKQLPFDHAKALKPVTSTVHVPVLVAVSAESPHKSLADLIAFAKANKDTVTFGTGGAGSAPHFASEHLQQVAGVTMRHIPYKGAGEAMTGLVSKQIDVLVVSTPSAMAQIKGGRIRALAVSGDKRVAALPDAPTFREAGLPGFGVVNWNGIAAPAGTPADVVDKLRAEIVKALAAPDMRDFLATMSAAPGGIDPSAFAKLIADETTLWAPVAAKAAIEKQ
jgi:tripartite-type tricarboxylate transporter receptor subunit TctC